MTIDTLIHIALAGLAASRVAFMVTREAGPLQMFEHWRGFVWARGGWIAELFDCPYCLSVWLVVVFLPLPTAVLAVGAAMWLAFVGLRMMEK